MTDILAVQEHVQPPDTQLDAVIARDRLVGAAALVATEHLALPVDLTKWGEEECRLAEEVGEKLRGWASAGRWYAENPVPEGPAEHPRAGLR